MKEFKWPLVFLLVILCFGCTTTYLKREVNLTINSEPPDAKIYEEGKLLGQAPLNISYEYEVGLNIGIYYVSSSNPSIQALLRPRSYTAIKDGYRPQTKSFQFASPYKEEFETTAGVGNLGPKGDFFHAGQSLLLALEPEAAKSQQQQQQQQQTVIVNVPGAGGAAKTYGMLTIISTPTQAEIYIDGAIVATTPAADLQVEAGTHKIEIKKSGYKTWDRTWRVLANSPVKIEATLEKI